MRIIFLEPDVIHPDSDTETIFEVAKYLECKYHICESFCEYISNKLLNKMIKLTIDKMSISRSLYKKQVFIIEQWLQNEWRDYVLSGKIDILTEAAKEREGVSFVNTGAYYLSMIIQLKE